MKTDRTKTGKTEIAGKRATPLTFSDDDTALLSEALRIAVMDILRVARIADLRMPKSLLIERLRIAAEQMTDLRERIDAS